MSHCKWSSLLIVLHHHSWTALSSDCKGKFDLWLDYNEKNWLFILAHYSEYCSKFLFRNTPSTVCIELLPDWWSLCCFEPLFHKHELILEPQSVIQHYKRRDLACIHPSLKYFWKFWLHKSCHHSCHLLECGDIYFIPVFRPNLLWWRQLKTVRWYRMLHLIYTDPENLFLFFVFFFATFQ